MTSSLSFGQRGITVVTITLLVGPATFQPVRVTTIEAHRMGAEQIEISEETAEAITRAKKERRRVVGVGTTVARALESAASPGRNCPLDDRTNHPLHCSGLQVSDRGCNDDEFSPAPNHALDVSVCVRGAGQPAGCVPVGGQRGV